MNCKERLTMRTTEGACMIIHADNEIEAEQEFCDKFKLMCNKLAELEDKLENGTLVELPCKVGSDVYVSSNNGKNFYIGTLYGKKENGSYLVFVHHKVGALIPYPLENNAFYDWFFKIYSKEEAEARLKELQNEVK